MNPVISNPAAIMSLIGDLYSQVAQLAEENAALREQLARLTPPAQSGATAGS